MVATFSSPRSVSSEECRLQWLQPFDEPEFIQKSVVCHSETWRARYQAAKAKLTTKIRSAPQDLGPLATGSDPYERCNLWLFETCPFCMEPIRFDLSVSGTLAAVTVRVGLRTCIKKSKGRPGKSPGSIPGLSRRGNQSVLYFDSVLYRFRFVIR